MTDKAGESAHWVPLSQAEAGWEGLRVREPRDLEGEDLAIVGVRIVRGYLEKFGYEVAEGTPGDCDLVALDSDTTVMVRVRTWAVEGDPQSVISEGSLDDMRAPALARTLRSRGRLSLRHDALSLVVAAKGRAQACHFVGVCEWKG